MDLSDISRFFRRRCHGHRRWWRCMWTRGKIRARYRCWHVDILVLLLLRHHSGRFSSFSVSFLQRFCVIFGIVRYRRGRLQVLHTRLIYHDRSLRLLRLMGWRMMGLAITRRKNGQGRSSPLSSECSAFACRISVHGVSSHVVVIIHDSHSLSLSL